MKIFVLKTLHPFGCRLQPTLFWILKICYYIIYIKIGHNLINRILRYLTRVNFRLVITVGRFSSFSALFSWKLSPSILSNSWTLSSITSFVKKYVESLSHKNKIQKHIVVIVEAWRIVAFQEWKIYRLKNSLMIINLPKWIETW